MRQGIDSVVRQMENAETLKSTDGKRDASDFVEVEPEHGKAFHFDDGDREEFYLKLRRDCYLNVPETKFFNILFFR